MLNTYHINTKLDNTAVVKGCGEVDVDADEDEDENGEDVVLWDGWHYVLY